MDLLYYFFPVDTFRTVFSVLKDVYGDVWWIVSPAALFFIVRDLWLYYLRWKRFLATEQILLEVRIPKIVDRTPKAMEQVISGFHAIYDDARFIEKYFQGKYQQWVSLEIASIDGVTHFYIHAPRSHKNLIQSHVWAQYPEAEIAEAEDYARKVPQDIPNKGWDMWGAEFILAKKDVYPIRTYPEFEENIEEKRIDPLAAMLETFGSIGPGEQLWMQIMIEPVLGGWFEAGKEEVDALISRKREKKQSQLSRTMSGVTGVLTPTATPVKPERSASEPPSMMMHLSPGEKDVIAAIEMNTAKLAFRTGIRVVYVGRTEVFNKSIVAGFFGSIRQFNTTNLNSLRPFVGVMPKTLYIMGRQRNFYRKRRLMRLYRLRLFAKKRFLFSTEGLATIYHFPGSMVAGAPLVTRIEAKKGEPPASLPITG